ncbi:hypothetical protein [Streptomyces sp. NPDC046887]|uniref:hypothetical protein n=1 Tax=Streptomyces sp. NPDC046887 TaxID=3155472 RepID=UPI0033F3C83C
MSVFRRAAALWVLPRGVCPKVLVLTEASIAAEAWKTPVAYVDIPEDTYCAEAAATGLDPWWLYAFSSMFASVREQRWDRVGHDYTQLTGRSPLALRDVLSAYR